MNRLWAVAIAIGLVASARQAGTQGTSTALQQYTVLSARMTWTYTYREIGTPFYRYQGNWTLTYSARGGGADDQGLITPAGGSLVLSGGSARISGTVTWINPDTRLPERCQADVTLKLPFVVSLKRGGSADQAVWVFGGNPKCPGPSALDVGQDPLVSAVPASVLAGPTIRLEVVNERYAFKSAPWEGSVIWSASVTAERRSGP